jgi:excisionase family DNA binding protein
MELERQTYTVEQAGKILGLSRGSTYAAAKAGTIPVLKFGKRRLVSKAALAKLLSGESGRAA